MKEKKGAIQFDEVMKWVIGLIVLALVLSAIFRGEGFLSGLKDKFLNFLSFR